MNYVLCTFKTRIRAFSVTVIYNNLSLQINLDYSRACGSLGILGILAINLDCVEELARHHMYGICFAFVDTGMMLSYL